MLLSSGKKDQSENNDSADISVIEDEGSVGKKELSSGIMDDPQEIKALDDAVAVDEEEEDYNVRLKWDYNVDENGMRNPTVPGMETGIAISYYQGKIDWNKVRDYGIDYAIIRVGFRGYKTGEIHKDEMFDEYIAGAKAAGIKTGVYFFSQAVSMKEVDEEVDFIMENVKEYDLDSYVVTDCAYKDDVKEQYRTKALSPEKYAKLQKYFCEKVGEKGYVPVIFNSKKTFDRIESKGRDNIYDGYLKWIYEETEKLSDEENCVMWQYSMYQTIEGIENIVSVGFGKHII